jgi:DNA-binding transcriptional regulator YiaG
VTTLAIALKDEIRRLARKEIKAQTGRTARAVAQYRREIALLKRQHRELERQLSKLKNRALTGRPDEEGTELNGDARFSARSVKAQRRRTGLSAADYARLVGVSPLTIYNWENKKSRPRKEQLATIVALRGLGKREAHAKLAQLPVATPRPVRTSRPRRRKK